MSDALYTNKGVRIQVHAGKHSLCVTVKTTATERTVLRLDSASALALAVMLAEAAEEIDLEAQTKYCPQCHKTKVIGEFFHDRTRADGHSAYCRLCKLALNRPTSRAHYWKMKQKRLEESAA